MQAISLAISLHCADWPRRGAGSPAGEPAFRRALGPESSSPRCRISMTRIQPRASPLAGTAEDQGSVSCLSRLPRRRAVQPGHICGDQLRIDPGMIGWHRAGGRAHEVIWFILQDQYPKITRLLVCSGASRCVCPSCGRRNPIGPVSLRKSISTRTERYAADCFAPTRCRTARFRRRSSAAQTAACW